MSYVPEDSEVKICAHQCESVVIAMRDLGEFIKAHPLGRRVAASLGLKQRLMRLMCCRNEAISAQGLHTLQILLTPALTIQ